MKQQKENNKPIPMFTRIMAGFLALLMLAGTIFGILMYIL